MERKFSVFFLALVLALWTNLVYAQGRSKNGQYAAPYRQAISTINYELYETIDFRYQGCYDTSSGTRNPLNGIVTPVAQTPNRLNCARRCWATNLIGTNDASYPIANWIYYAQYPDANGVVRCACGNSTQTAHVDGSYCNAVGNATVCPGVGGANCGGPSGAVVNLRDDIGGSCANNASASLDGASGPW